MQSTPKIEQFIPISEELTKFAYQAFQQSKTVFAVAHNNISSRLTNLVVEGRKGRTTPVSAEVLNKLQKRREKLFEADLQDAVKGVYPANILFDNPWEDFFRYYPEVWLDLPEIWETLQKKEYQKFSSDIDREGYPAYYLQNFHQQTNGYLSDMSANLYDLQVELVFNGAADAMRRRILAPLKQWLSAFAPTSPEQIKVLDVACGTGRTLRFIRATLPKASLFGVDLSPAYLRKANQLLSTIPGELPQLIQANGEELPYLDNYFHALTSVFLFHELPPQARQRVIEESFRVVKPGGVFIICDSMQAIDNPDFKVMMDNFPIIFHEPYYRNYTTDDLVRRLEKAGFENVRTENHLVSKYWIARKPVL